MAPAADESAPPATPNGVSSKKLPNGVPLTNGEDCETHSSSSSSAELIEPSEAQVDEVVDVDENVRPGMKCGLTKLYSGKEDKDGQFQWQNTLPEDLGTPAENAETAKYALVVRYVRVYNDPRRVLSMHSILIQSPLLKKLLEQVLKNYPGVTTSLNRLEFSDRFEPLIHRWSELEEAIGKLGHESEDEVRTKEHAELLHGLLKKEFKLVIEASQDMKSKGVMTYEYLWTLFQPGSIVYIRHDNQDRAVEVHASRYGEDSDGNPCFWLTCLYVDWDGARFGTEKLASPIHAYNGTRRISKLPLYPLDSHPKRDEMKKALTERGAKFEALAGSHCKAYDGVGWKRGQGCTKERYSVKGRIVVDTYGWNRFQPNDVVNVTPLRKSELSTHDSSESDGEEGDEGESEDETSGDVQFKLSRGVLQPESKSSRSRLTPRQRLLCTPLLRGYSLKDKLWLHLYVNSVYDIEWNTKAFDSLIMPANQKELILGFAESQRKFKDNFDDFIEGKGKGIIILLYGPPGLGKTSTCEVLAERMEVPLYMMSAGDLGYDPRYLENNLQKVLDICTKWNAILLIDEADVFLEQRSLHEIERNKLVAIFLRVLEYYPGIMFLTTNRVQTFDPAFHSRIHISLDYRELSTESKLVIWKNFLSKSIQEHSLTDQQLDRLSLMDMNGRQIKNVLKTAQLLAARRETPLSYEHIMTVLDVTQHLHTSTQETERQRASLFA